MPRVLITGGAGFIGANLAVGLASRHPDWGLVAFDNLHRRGSEVPVERDPNPRPGDIPVYISDCARLFEHTRWRPRRSAATILRDIFAWVADNRDLVGRALGFRV
jgi:nucleoside-diphosphate-sugar epimerase